VRVVLDTNVLISALLFDGIPERIFLAGLRGEIQLLTSLSLLEELGRVLKDKFKIDVHTVANTIELVRSVAEIVEVKSRIRVILHPDGDNRVLECAGDGKADVLVTGDTKHILPLSKYKGARILSPAEFVRFLRPSLP
jgi:putative PIN family toxin of toxin-antitoxin system